ncbi:MAG: FAD-dependent oxidoreductase [Candidatus Bathyarchaeota archaeon]
MKFETKIVNIIERTSDVKSFQLSCPSSFEYTAGQFMFVTIPRETGELKKHFTISSSPTEKDFIEFTKKLTGSQYSNALCSLKIGDTVTIDAPYGDFTLDKKIEKVGMLSGGIGITPLRSMCKYSTDLKLNYDIILLYGNNSLEEIAFKEELDKLSKENKNLKVVYTLNNFPNDWKGYKGFINSDMIKIEIPDYKNRVFYTCGPPAMVEAMKKLLGELNISKDKIRIENFSGY